MLTLKKLCMTALFVVLFASGTFLASAADDTVVQSIYEQSGADSLGEALEHKTQQRLKEDNISVYSADGVSFESIMKTLVSSAKSQSAEPFGCAIKLIGIMLLTVMIQGFSDGIGERTSDRVLNTVAGCASSVCLFMPLCQLANRASDTVSAAGNFSFVFTPVYAAILASSGRPVTATAFSAWSVAAGAFFSYILKAFVLPLCMMLLGFAVISACGSGFGLDAAAQSVAKGVKWVLGICSVIFVGVISLRGVVSANADSLAFKTTKFIISGAVPIIGSALGDAALAVQSGLATVKGGVGAFGIIAFAYIFIPVITETILWSAVIAFCSFMANLLGAKQIEKTFTSAGAVTGMLFASELFSLSVIIVSSAWALK